MTDNTTTQYLRAMNIITQRTKNNTVYSCRFILQLTRVLCRSRRKTTGTAVEWSPNATELPTYRYWFDSLANTSAKDPEQLDGASVAKFLLKSGLDPSLLKKVRLGISFVYVCMYVCMHVCVCVHAWGKRGADW